MAYRTHNERDMLSEYKHHAQPPSFLTRGLQGFYKGSISKGCIGE